MISEQVEKYQGQMATVVMLMYGLFIGIGSFCLASVFYLALSFLKVLCTLPSEWHLLKIKCTVDGNFSSNFYFI